MPTQAATLPIMGQIAGFRRFTVDEYHRLIGGGYLTENDNMELIEGYLVMKMPRNPPHDGSVQKANRRLTRAVPPGWEVRVQSAVTLSSSEPEPDIAVVREDVADYTTHHPTPADIGLLVEVSDSTLDGDRIDKVRIYGRDNVPYYWIINLIDRQVEVHSDPTGPVAAPGYATRQVYGLADAVPLMLDGATIGTIPVRDWLP